MPVEQPPLILAMVLADSVLVDVATGKNTIQGTYQALSATTFPFTSPSIVVYVAITEGYGQTTLRLQLVDVDEAGPPIFEAQTVLDLPDPLDVHEIVFSERNVTFPEPGEYRVQLFAGDEPLLERRLQIGLDR